MNIFGDGIRMVDPIDPLGHEHRLLLELQCLWIISHDVIKPGQHALTLGDFWMHGAVDVVQQVQGLVDQFVAVFQVALLDLGLAYE